MQSHSILEIYGYIELIKEIQEEPKSRVKQIKKKSR